MIAVEKIPTVLAEEPQWVLWKNVERDGHKTKLPYQVDGTMAKANDSTTWTTIIDAISAYDKGGYDGIGFVFSDVDDFCGVDLDGCRDPESGKVEDWARKIIKELDSYAEVSPSKTGVKVFCLAKSPFKRGRKVDLDLETLYGKTPGIEIYDHLRYFAITGNRLDGISKIVEDRQSQVELVCQIHFPPEKAPRTFNEPTEADVVSRAGKYIGTMPASISGQSGHNAAFKVACALILGFGLSEDDAYGLLCQWNQGCQPPWNERELAHKITSAGQQGGERNYLRNANKNNYVPSDLPAYKPPERTLSTANETENQPVETTLETSAHKYIKAVSEGTNELIQLGVKDVDDSLGGGVEWGEVVLVGARTSHGKTAFALQVISTMTAEGIPALMISEEMSDLAIGKRTIQRASEVPEPSWKDSLDEVSNHVECHFSSRAPCYIVEACRTAAKVEEVVDRYVEEKGVKLVVVDYAQHLGGSGSGRYEIVTNTSVILRRLTTRHNIILIELCQLNRGIESRDKFIPRLSDIKDSGQLEQDADVALFLVYPWKLDTSNPPDLFNVFIAKNRNRQIITPAVKCKFIGARQMIESIMPANYDQSIEDFNSEPRRDIEHTEQGTIFE